MTFVAFWLIDISGDAIAASSREHWRYDQISKNALPHVVTGAGARFKECDDCPAMTVVPGGSFMMGSPPSELGHFKNEGPLHRVDIKHGFAVSTFHIVRKEFAEFINQSGYSPARGCHVGDSGSEIESQTFDWKYAGFAQTEYDPVLCINKKDALAYISWLNGRVASPSNGLGNHAPYRLLSEAEYEYAARAGTSTPYWWGQKASHDFANYGLAGCGPCGPAIKGRDRWLFTSPAGSFPANRFGLYDMLGNAWSYIADCWHSSYAGAPADGTAWIEPECNSIEERGAGWLDDAHYLRAANRAGGPDDGQRGSQQIGFRVARDLDED